MVCQSCGNLRSVCSDRSLDWFPQRDMCYATAARELTMRRVQKKHAKPDRQKATQNLHPLDGMAVWVSQHDLTPDDGFV